MYKLCLERTVFEINLLVIQSVVLWTDAQVFAYAVQSLHYVFAIDTHFASRGREQTHDDGAEKSTYQTA